MSDVPQEVLDALPTDAAEQHDALYLRPSKEIGVKQVFADTSPAKAELIAALPVRRSCSDKHGGRDMKALGKGTDLPDVQLPLTA